MKRKWMMILILGAVMLSGCESAPSYVTPSELAERAGVPYDASIFMESETEGAETEEPTIPPPEIIDGEVIVKNNILLVNSGTDHTRAIAPFYANREAGAQYAETLNSYRAALPEGINVYSMVIPTAAAYYTPEDKADHYGDQEAEIADIVSHLSGVTDIPVYTPLLYHRHEPIYLRTDHYWQPLGAYYAGAELAKAAGLSYLSLEGYDQVDREFYTGAFLEEDQLTELDNAPETFTYYRPVNLDMLHCYVYDPDFTNGRTGSLFDEDIPVNSSSMVYIGTNDCIFRTETDVENHRVLVIFKDTYGNALVPFLTGTFSTIYLCDFRYFQTDPAAFVEKVGATDILFAMSVQTCTTQTDVDVIAKTFINRQNPDDVSE